MKIDFEFIQPHWAAAALGALVGLKALPGANLAEKAGNVGAGFAIAAWGGPALVDWLNITSPNVGSGVVFSLGACGLVLFNALIAAIKATNLGGHLDSVLSRFSGRREGDQ